MGFFAMRRTGVDAGTGAGGGRPCPTTQSPVPVQFEAVAEALAAGADVCTRCAVLGTELARDGAGLSEALEGLRSTFVNTAGHEPSYAAVQALSLAWSEETLSYLHQLSCEDPLTGLASHAHLRARLSELYRAARSAGSKPGLTHALVVVELPALDNHSDHFSRALWLVQAGQQVRGVFAGGDPICTIGQTRLVVLTARSVQLGRSVCVLRDRLSSGVSWTRSARVWTEGLPSTDDSAGCLLDELSRR